MNIKKTLITLTAGIFSFASLAHSGVSGDFTGDGTADYLIRNDSSGAWILNTESGAQALSGVTINSDWQPAAITDLNGDGSSDILMRNKDGRWWGYLMNGSTVLSEGSINMSANTSWKLLGSGDFDGDGNGDILLRRADTGNWFIYLMDGLSVASSGTPAGMASNQVWDFRDVADFNGDGMADVLLRNSNNAAWFIYAMNGLATLNDPSALGAAKITANPNWTFQAAADFNGDEKADVVLRRTDGPWFLYPMDGINKITDNDFGLLSITANTAWELTTASDSTGDGYADVLLRNGDDGRWYRYSFVGKTRNDSDTGPLALENDLAWEDFTSASDVDRTTPDQFSVAALEGRTFYLTWFGLGEPTEGQEVDNLAVVEKIVFGTDGMLTITGLLNSYHQGTRVAWGVSEDGVFSGGDDGGSDGNRVVCGSTDQYIKTHYEEDGAYDNTDLFFFDEGEALSYASSLTESVAPCSSDLPTVSFIDLPGQWSLTESYDICPNLTVDYATVGLGYDSGTYSYSIAFHEDIGIDHTCTTIVNNEAGEAFNFNLAQTEFDTDALYSFVSDADVETITINSADQFTVTGTFTTGVPSNGFQDGPVQFTTIWTRD